MSDLDDKIRGALEGTDTFVLDPSSEYLGRIKQAFIDAGWLRTVDVSLPAVTPYIPEPLMTGQEWYDRFIRELPAPFPLEAGDPQEAVDYYAVKLSAKKAAGIE